MANGSELLRRDLALVTEPGDPAHPYPPGFKRAVLSQVLRALKRVTIPDGEIVYRPSLNQFSQGSRLISLREDDVLRALVPDIASRLPQLHEEFSEGAARLAARVGPGAPGDLAVPLALDAAEAFVLYAAIRHLAPSQVVETGICNGFSSYFILQALERNHKGRLASFDVAGGAGNRNRPGRLTTLDVPGGVGKLLRPEDIGRWDATIFGAVGPRTLERELDALPKVDLFFHDSAHTYANQMTEYRTAWSHLAAGGVVASADADANFAYLDFAKVVEERPCCLVVPWRVFGILRHGQVRQGPVSRGAERQVPERADRPQQQDG